MTLVLLLNDLFGLICLLLYLHQFVYLAVSLLKKPMIYQKAEAKDIAILICARNEEAVIGDLLWSLECQTHPKEKLHVFVCADHCTDRTARQAKEQGAEVYVRDEGEGRSKAYVLDYLMRSIRRDYPGGFDGYIILDADNLLKPDYVEKMSDALSAGNEIITSYRNSKNFGDSWISAGSALWFFRECRNLHQARSTLGLSCLSSGTGYLFSRAVAQELSGWPYRTMTEDIEFTMDQILKGRKIAYCAEAELFDEQPTTFHQSWIQRLRWSKGFLQNFQIYARPLFQKMTRGSFTCYDMLTTLLPVNCVTMAVIMLNLLMAGGCCLFGDQSIALLHLCAVLKFFGGFYLTTLLYASVVMVIERKRIRAGKRKCVLCLFTTPIFNLTYLPISFAALFAPAVWKPITHRVSMKELRSRPMEERLPL